MKLLLLCSDWSMPILKGSYYLNTWIYDVTWGAKNNYVPSPTKKLHDVIIVRLGTWLCFASFFVYIFRLLLYLENGTFINSCPALICMVIIDSYILLIHILPCFGLKTVQSCSLYKFCIHNLSYLNPKCILVQSVNRLLRIRDLRRKMYVYFC